MPQRDLLRVDLDDAHNIKAEEHLPPYQTTPTSGSYGVVAVFLAPGQRYLQQDCGSQSEYGERKIVQNTERCKSLVFCKTDQAADSM